MQPILFTIGSLSITSFGFFLALSFLTGIFVIWKLAKIYDISEEKILDLALLTFVGSLLGSRVYFVALHLDIFDSLEKILLVNKYAGLSFWGGLAGGLLTLSYFLRRSRFNFWQIIDFAAVGALAGLAVGDIGCFLGGCAYGITSTSFLAMPVVGLVGKRMPISLIESIVFILAFFYLWRQVIRFHFAGKITALFLIILGVVKTFSQHYRGDSIRIQMLPSFPLDTILSLLLLVSGVFVFYKKSKRNFIKDLKWVINLPISKKRQMLLLSYIKKSWYNYKVNFKIQIGNLSALFTNLPKVIKRRLNVKSTPTNLR